MIALLTSPEDFYGRRWEVSQQSPMDIAVMTQSVSNSDIQINLNAFNQGLRQEGKASIIAEGDKTRIVIDMGESINALEPQPAYLQKGSCQDPGEVVYPLNYIQNGQSVTIVQKSREAIMIENSSLIITAQAKNESFGNILACGEVENEVGDD